MSLIGLLLALVVICLVVWAVRALLAAFSIDRAARRPARLSRMPTAVIFTYGSATGLAITAICRGR
jgi:hypothetical protein